MSVEIEALDEQGMPPKHEDDEATESTTVHIAETLHRDPEPQEKERDRLMAELAAVEHALIEAKFGPQHDLHRVTELTQKEETLKAQIAELNLYR